MRLIDADVLLEKVREIRTLALDRAVETPANMPFPIYQNPAYTRYSTQADEREKFKVMIEEAPSAQPERKTGHWILDRSGAYCCNRCMEPCASYAMGKPRDKFCKMCGSRNEV